MSTIAIYNTDVHFIIRNNILDGIDASQMGIKLKNVKHANLSENMIYDCNDGLLFENVSYTTVYQNIIQGFCNDVQKTLLRSYMLYPG